MLDFVSRSRTLIVGILLVFCWDKLQLPLSVILSAWKEATMANSSTTLTRDEFITGYLARSDIQGLVERTSNGWTWDGHRYWAIRCDCGDESCEGWAMISARHHMAFNAFEGEPRPNSAVDPDRRLLAFISKFGPIPKGMRAEPLESSDGFLLVPIDDA
jgi:hypothetical protein